jgi:hypothetical protein
MWPIENSLIKPIIHLVLHETGIFYDTVLNGCLNSRRADDEFGERILGNQKLKKLYYLNVSESGFESR